MVAVLVCQHPCAAYEVTRDQDLFVLSDSRKDAALIDKFMKDLKLFTTDSLLLRIWLDPFNGQFQTKTSLRPPIRLQNDVDKQHEQVSPSEVIGLNNEGVKDLNKADYLAAIKMFELALAADPDYKLALDNLAIAYNNFGLAIRNKPSQALKQFHSAMFVNPANKTTAQNVEGIIRMMGKDPMSVKDRIQFADQCNSEGDFLGAVVEYSAALELKQDPLLRAKLLDAFAWMKPSQKMLNPSFVKIDTAVSVVDKQKNVPQKSYLYATHSTVKKDDPDFVGYMADLQRRIKMNWSPPKANTSSRAVVIFKLNGKGELLKLQLDKSSGLTIADIHALRAVEMAAPFPPLPEGAAPTVDIQFTFDYNVWNGGGIHSSKKELKVLNAEPAYPYASLASYMNDLESRIKKTWGPPAGHESAIVSVLFRVNANGEVSDLKLYRSSGHATADEAALQAIQRAAPFAIPPARVGVPLDVQYTFDRRLLWSGKPF
jgi:TonB family protein